MGDLAAQFLVGEFRQANGGRFGVSVQLQQGVLDLPAPARERVGPGQQGVFLRPLLLVSLDMALLPPRQRMSRQTVAAQLMVVVARLAAQEPVDQAPAVFGLGTGGEHPVDLPGAGRQVEDGAQGVRRGGIGLGAAERDGGGPWAGGAKQAIVRRRAGRFVASDGAEPVCQLGQGNDFEAQALRCEQRGKLFAARRAVDETESRPVLQGNEEAARLCAMEWMFELAAQAGAVGEDRDLRLPAVALFGDRPAG
ncbi:hypothetical protein, partial [Candidatus Accumulibacter vicinus]|uniref:hypothetical protein n=1 Tax=Candidatus Accumulibacter vicinus TaxID=2954382 RepID=UPI00235B6386